MIHFNVNFNPAGDFNTVEVGGMAYFFENVFEFCTWVLFWEAFYIRTTNQKQFFDLRHFPSIAPAENVRFSNFPRIFNKSQILRNIFISWK